ncbi:hypothetical protein BB560_001261 [Smittium megazygosporum]|uniref:Uncharacterized protein n=1 Tax=Smittium megazygosporum TaxID=133381 RepID=A0A2T9ZI11_9FUNG|nr:hypothetical protein BB560_001261 [Smittium megazygosporum]
MNDECNMHLLRPTANNRYISVQNMLKHEEDIGNTLGYALVSDLEIIDVNVVFKVVRSKLLELIQLVLDTAYIPLMWTRKIRFK